MTLSTNPLLSSCQRHVGPLSDFYTPIFDKLPFDGLTGQDVGEESRVQEPQPRKLVGLLTGYLYWAIYFINILPDGAPTIHVVLENTCGQEFTYAIHGQQATYVGSGDLHDTKYDDTESSTTEFGTFLDQSLLYEDGVGNVDDLPPGQCLYKIHVYPTEEFEQHFLTLRPIYFSCGLVATFLVTSIVFLIYDCVVERRQRLLLQEERKQRLVVSSLFPETVRDRIYETTNNQEDKGNKKKGKDKNGTTDSKESWLKKSQSKGDDPIVLDEDGNGEDDDDGGAIADRHENCSVVFMDLAGFTKWSDGRDPSVRKYEGN